MMRRGTPAAVEFGKLLRKLREDSGQTMHQVADKMGTYAATISQMETAERACKEHRLGEFADALGVSLPYLKKAWKKAQEDNPNPPIVRGRSKSVRPMTLMQYFNQLDSRERSQVKGYIDRIIETREV